jgi:hypothetical protein
LGFVSIKCDKNIRIKSFLKKFFLQWIKNYKIIK